MTPPTDFDHLTKQTSIFCKNKIPKKLSSSDGTLQGAYLVFNCFHNSKWWKRKYRWPWLFVVFLSTNLLIHNDCNVNVNLIAKKMTGHIYIE